MQLYLILLQSLPLALPLAISYEPRQQIRNINSAGKKRKTDKENWYLPLHHSLDSCNYSIAPSNVPSPIAVVFLEEMGAVKISQRGDGAMYCTFFIM